MTRKKVLIISILGMPEVLRDDLFDNCLEGRTDLEWITRRLKQIGFDKQILLDFVDISQGDQLPPAHRYDGVIIGGSVHNANEGHYWQLLLFDWLRTWRTTGRPLFGICGGHQHAAIALHGKVSVHPKGPFAQTKTIELTAHGVKHFLFSHLTELPMVHLGHFDHVTRIPNGSEVLATYRDTIQALDMGGNWITVQFHPEASPNIMVTGWDNELHDIDIRYHPAGTGRRFFENFFRGTGLVT